MNHQKNLIYGLVVAAGFILVWIIYADQGIDPKPEIPKLSNFVAHMQYIDESTCLKCHATEREMNFGSGPMMVKKMPHEFRENCVSCHILPK